ncbi:MAG: phosphoribosylformylglycinamidine synthase subunit PurS [Elusimicrobia bacterium]|nr:phosphoribosylformylglycinamidine synthase subunit PurS [Elusimicrobiota bacterium]
MSAVRVQPVSTHLIEIRLRPEFADAEGAEALARLRAEGLSALKDVRVSRLYEIKGAITATQVQQAARELLCDAVTQESRVVNPGTPPLNGMNFWRVEVWPKPTVADPPGETVRDAIAEMGLPRPDSVRCALVYRLLGRSSRAVIEKAVEKALANPLIHRFVVSEAHP